MTRPLKPTISGNTFFQSWYRGLPRMKWAPQQFHAISERATPLGSQALVWGSFHHFTIFWMKRCQQFRWKDDGNNGRLAATSSQSTGRIGNYTIQARTKYVQQPILHGCRSFKLASPWLTGWIRVNSGGQCQPQSSGYEPKLVRKCPITSLHRSRWVIELFPGLPLSLNLRVNHAFWFCSKKLQFQSVLYWRILIASSQLHPSRPLITMMPQMQKWATKEGSCLAIPCQWKSKPQTQTKEATTATISGG